MGNSSCDHATALANCSLLRFWWHLTHVLVPLVAATGETWHMVDLAAVVCPKPTNLKAGAETLPEYNVGIDMSVPWFPMVCRWLAQTLPFHSRPDVVPPQTESAPEDRSVRWSDGVVSPLQGLSKDKPHIAACLHQPFCFS